MWTGTFTLEAGEYEYKIAFDGDWAVNYGADATHDGDNVALVLEETTEVTFTFDPNTNMITDSVNDM